MTEPKPPSYEQSQEGYGPTYPSYEQSQEGYGPTYPSAPYPPAGYSDPAYPPNAAYPPTAYSDTPYTPQGYGGPAYPPVAQGATKAPPPTHIHPIPVSSSDAETGGFTSRNFDNKAVRRLFIRKVYITLSIQLLVTFGITALVYFTAGVKNWVQNDGIWMYYVSYVVFLSTYIALVCCSSVRRKSPHNIIALSIFTLALSYMVAMITTFYDISSVLIAFGITCGITVGVTIFSMQTKFDFTLCGGFLFMFSLSLFIFGFIAIFTYSEILYTVYAWLGAVLFSLFLAYDTQLIMGGKRHELDPEEHIYGALTLYIDIVYIFLFILAIFGGKN